MSTEEEEEEGGRLDEDKRQKPAEFPQAGPAGSSHLVVVDGQRRRRGRGRRIFVAVERARRASAPGAEQ